MSKSSITVGLLLCDTMHDYLLDLSGGDYDHLYADCLSQADDTLIFKSYRTHLGELPSSTSQCDVWLISGSPNSVYNDLAWIKNLIDFVKQLTNANKPLVGICFGHQVIAAALGGKVEKSDRGWGLGMAQYAVSKPAQWMQPSLDRYNIWVFHEDQITQLPVGAQILSGNDFCPAFLVQYNPVTMSIQGHPEFFKGFFTRVLGSDEFDSMPDIRAQGLANLEGEHDGPVLFSWIAEFLRQAFNTCASKEPNKATSSASR
ncbi:MAG TPA: GMP synthase [Oceanospirillaceae bacterium]|nr:GMP synthase [Oceanospirillaceae bacterium]